MRVLISFIVFMVLSVISGASDAPKDWNEDVDWFTSLDEAMEVSKKEHKPIMLVIHKSWCGACKALKPQFHASKEIGTLSKHFIMVNAGDDDEPHGAEYKPDGGYIPRILFIENGEVREDLINKKGNPKYKYYYNAADLVIETMKTALETMDLEVLEGLKEEL